MNNQNEQGLTEQQTSVYKLQFHLLGDGHSSNGLVNTNNAQRRSY